MSTQSRMNAILSSRVATLTPGELADALVWMLHNSTAGNLRVQMTAEQCQAVIATVKLFLLEEHAQLPRG